MGSKFLYIVILFNVLLCTRASSQNLSRDLAGYSNWLATENSFEVKILIDVFFDQNDAKPRLTLNGEIARHKASYRSKIFDNEIFSENKKILYINHKFKTMVFRKDVDVNKKNDPSQYDISATLAFIDSSLRRCDTITFLGVENGVKTYLLVSSKQVISSIYLSFSTDKSLLKKVVYYYNTDVLAENNKVVMTYSYPDVSAGQAQSNLLLADYLIEKDGKPVPAARFKNYQLKIQ